MRVHEFKAKRSSDTNDAVKSAIEVKRLRVSGVR
jgi:hypothetical protein